MNYLTVEYDYQTLRLMWALKLAIDPQLLMNPGKILPAL